MVNDTNTLNGALMELGETLASNLSNMGVNANANNGLTTLAEKILDINKFQNGLFIKTNDNITQTGSTLWIIAIPLDNNKLLSEKYETVDFYLNGNTLIDSVSTDDWGIASTTLTGAGVGECIIHAEYNGESSEQINLFDCMKYDKGLLSKHTDIWAINTESETILVTRTDDYTEFAEKTSANIANAITGLEDESIIEFDYYQVDGVATNSFLQIQDSNSTSIYSGGINLNVLGGSVGNWYHIKIELSNGTLTGTNMTTGTTFTKMYTSAPYRFTLWTSGTTTAVRFKDFRVYKVYDDSVSTVSISANKPTIQSTETSTLTITPKGENGYPVRNIDIDLYKNGTLLTTLNSGANGKATYTYTATGIGEVEFKAKYGTIQSEIYTLLDAIYYDSCTSDTSSRYYADTSKGNSIAFSTDKLLFTLGTGNQYTQLDTNNDVITLSDYLGKSIRFKCDVNPSRRGRLQIWQQADGSWSSASSSWVTTESTIYVDADIDENATRVQFRVGGNGTGATSGDTIDIQNIRIYPV